MEKKLTAQGPRGRESYTITLPKEWVTAEKLHKTRVVDLEIAGNKVVIAPCKHASERAIIDAANYKNSFVKVIPALYRLGIDEIQFNVDDETLIERLQETIEQRLIGYEVVEHTKKTVLVKYIMKDSEEDFPIILRRIFLLMIELSETRSIIKVKALDRNIKRLCNYCQRTLITRGHGEFLKIPFYYLLLDQLNNLHDELRWIHLLERRTKKEEEYLKKITFLLEQAYHQFYKFNQEDYDRYQEQAYELKNEVKLSDTIDRAVIHIHNLARLINSMYGTIFALTFDKHLGEHAPMGREQ